ncbi:outer membrane beta-barrel protein [Alteromonas sp. ASW11-19]|uniref:Outer membrane beta-barrel protein n=1 Tax=Alteromonas salexigens TaxID=2982530 RepID=A0ABT2VSS3_9ALTE|nr:outer membrane beta-barrel protein [Alteromonas salexigens]MCU7556119.1 outer membrane beta-barrel protein [Alteromonas salexigens]
MFYRISGLAAFCFLGTSSPVVAQEAGRIDMQGFDLIPSLSTDMLYIDNVTYASEESAHITSWVGIISPQIKAVSGFGTNELEFVYRGERGEYFSSPADNYTDHFVHVAGNFEMDRRNRFTTKLGFEDGHDQRGRQFSSGFGNQLNQVDTYKKPGVSATYEFGSVSSPGRVELRAGYEELDYDNDSQAYLIRDRSYTKVGGQFFYRLAGRTHLVLDASHQQIDYDVAADPQSPLDNQEDRVLAGFTWESTAATTGFAKVGYKQKSFDAPGRESFEGIDWEAGLTWQPRTYSEIELATGADTRETNGEGDYIRSQDYRISWRHAWLTRFSTTMALAHEQNDYEGAEITTARNDDVTRAQLAADYQFRRWLQVGVFYEFSQRDSTRELVSFDRNVVGITTKVTL